MDYTSFGSPPNDDLTLRQAWANMLRGLTNKQQWQDVGQGIQNTAQIAPNVVESLARGQGSSVVGGMGDLRNLKQSIQSYLPEGVQNWQAGMETLANPMARALVQSAPTSEQTLAAVPRLTADYQGSGAHEAVGQLTTPTWAAKLVKQPLKLDKIGQALENRRLSDYPSLVKEYNLLEDSRGGKFLNTDTARELSQEYLKNRTLAASVHEPASSFIKQRYAEILSQPAPEGSTVVFTAGGTGAGKSSSLDAFPSITKNAEIVYDTNMNTLSSAEKKINQALEAGRNVDILYTYRDPEKALRLGSLQRAVRQKEKFGSGRTVPMKEHLRTHEGSREVIEQLQKKYEGDPRVRIGLVDNSYGLGEQKVVNDINELPRYNVEEMGKRLMKALEEEYKAGNITKEIYESSK